MIEKESQNNLLPGRQLASIEGDATQKGKFTVLDCLANGGKKPCSVPLKNGIAENVWYRLTMDVEVSGDNVTVTGKVFRHTTPRDADSGLDGQVGSTLTFSGPRPAGVDATGEVGIIAAAVSAVVDSSVTNMTITP